MHWDSNIVSLIEKQLGRQILKNTIIRNYVFNLFDFIVEIAMQSAIAKLLQILW